jgi:autoinducer 2-degrading protein
MNAASKRFRLLAFVSLFLPGCLAFSQIMLPFALNIQLNVAPERRDEFMKIIKYDGAQTLATEQGALQFVVGEDAETPNRFFLHELYKSKEDYEMHQKTDHFKAFAKFSETDPWVAEPAIVFFEGTHEPVHIPYRPAFCLNVKLCIKKEVREEFLRVIENNQKGSRKEPLCLQYDYGESSSEPNTFYFHEEYKGANDGKEGFDAHAAAPHFAVWEEFATTADPFTSPPVVNFFKALPSLEEE